MRIVPSAHPRRLVRHTDTDRRFDWLGRTSPHRSLPVVEMGMFDDDDFDEDFDDDFDDEFDEDFDEISDSEFDEFEEYDEEDFETPDYAADGFDEEIDETIDPDGFDDFDDMDADENTFDEDDTPGKTPPDKVS